jgi:hypothetical protein
MRYHGFAGFRELSFVLFTLSFAMLSSDGAIGVAQTDPLATLQTAQQAEPPNPAQEHRPPPKPKSMLIAKGEIKLDVVVNDSEFTRRAIRR